MWFSGEVRFRDRLMVLLYCGMGRGFWRMRVLGKGKRVRCLVGYGKPRQNGGVGQGDKRRYCTGLDEIDMKRCFV